MKTEGNWKPSVISETVASQIDQPKKWTEAKKENKEEAARIRNEILGLKRELNRTKQFTSIAWNKNIEGKNDLDSISASNLMRVDKEVSKEKRGEFYRNHFSINALRILRESSQKNQRMEEISKKEMFFLLTLEKIRVLRVRFEPEICCL